MLFLRVIAWCGAEKFSLKKVVSIFTSGGNMSFVGTRPEVVKYVKKYKPEYFATLLLPAGITSEASIKYKDEAELLDAAEDVDEVYITKVEFMGIAYTEEDLYAHVLAMEQIMSTGGGWQDQVGGITPGLKYITSMPGIDQKLKVTHVEIPEAAKQELSEE